MTRVKIERKVPKTGNKYVRKWRGINHEMTVVIEGGNIQYKVGEDYFKSPSAAAKHIIKQEVNGWRFWKIEG
jgi:sensor domain CHASE-containing protein